jgi:hypothetical protein
MTQKGRLIKVFERKEGKTRVYDNGFVESVINEHATIDVPYLLEGKKQLEETGIKKFYVLSDSKGTFKITNEAKALSAGAEYSSHIAAIAVVINNPAVAFIADLYLKLYRPVVITRTFSDINQAHRWLMTQIEDEPNGNSIS